jgi:hypothetical protein
MSDNGTEDRVLGSALGSGVHLYTILLIDEGDCDMLGEFEESGIVVGDHCITFGSEDNAS